VIEGLEAALVAVGLRAALRLLNGRTSHRSAGVCRFYPRCCEPAFV